MKSQPSVFSAAALFGMSLVAGSSTAWGQTDIPSQTAIDVQNYWPSAGPSQSISLRSSDIQPHLALGFALIANYMDHPLVLQEVATGLRHDAVSYAVTTDFVWGFGLFNRFQLNLAVPLVVTQSGEGITALVANGGPATQLSQTALRDIRFDLSVAVLQRARRTDADGLGLRIDLGGAAPVGDSGGFEGAPTWTFAPMLVADFRIKGLTITANVGARIRGTAAVGDAEWGNQGVLGFGLAYRPLAFNRLMVGVDVLALVPVYGPINVLTANGVSTYNPFTPVELFYGARYAIDRGRDIEVTLGGGAPLDNAPTVPAFRFILGLSYTPHGFDNDGDGVPDASDNCPTVPEDRDGFQDTDGCPDPDNDNDRIPDVADHCPNDPEDYDNFQDADGCPDPDNDQDGVADADDECPNEAQGDHPDRMHPGCPIRDRDHDGVLDGRDQCVDEPAGEHPDPARPGCPLPDRDHDGVPDALDLCPSDPEGAHADPYRLGCPDPDRDHDAVPNEIDRCPDEPETINGVADDDGCPDQGDEATSWAGNVIIFQQAIRLRAGVRAIARADANALAQAAQRIRGRGLGVDRVLVQVVPAAGAAGAREALRQATLVAQVLAAHGIPREQIDAGPVISQGPVTGHPVAASGTVGELRLMVRMHPLARRTATRARPASVGPAALPGSSAPPTTSAAPAASGSPAPASSSHAPILD